VTIKIPSWYMVVIWAHPFDFVRYLKRESAGVLFIHCPVRKLFGFQMKLNAKKIIFSDNEKEAFDLAEEMVRERLSYQPSRSSPRITVVRAA
jgi:hypothetical protein